MDNHIYISNLVQKTKELTIEDGAVLNVFPSIQSSGINTAEEKISVEASRDCVNEPIAFSNNKSLDEMDSLLSGFMVKITEMQLTKITTKTIFDIFRDFVEKMYNLNCDSIQRHPSDSIVDVLNGAKQFVLSKIHKFDSQFKCHKLIKNSDNYVKPQQICIGTQMKMKMDKKTNLRLPTGTRTNYEFISPIGTLKKVFSVKETRDIYFDYNLKKKHKCTPMEYTDFCCSQKFRQNELFAEFPDSIQLQLFIDGFAVTDGLKSAAGKHNQTAIYVAIRNMPPEFAYDMDNIFLVALCDSSHLKSDHVDYNDLWKNIVDDIRFLEDIGIYLENGRTLKGIVEFETV